MKPTKVALAGLGSTGLDYLDILEGSDRFEVVAIADSDQAVLRGHDLRGSFHIYEDYRSLIVESVHVGLDLLVVATESHHSIEFLSLAVDRGLAIFHKPPFARNLQEGRMLVERFETANCPFVIAREWHRDGWPTDPKTLAQRAGHVHTALGEIATRDEPNGWRGDSLRAGGGVLLNGAYAQVDLLVALLGMPDSVYAVCGFARAPGETLNYDTEDIALLLLRWGSDRSATLAARRGVTPGKWHVMLAGTRGTLVWPGAESSPDGEEEDAHHTDGIADQMSSVFGMAESGVRRAISTAKDHLATLAVIDAAYLSAKTGTAEVPARLPG